MTKLYLFIAACLVLMNGYSQNLIVSKEIKSVKVDDFYVYELSCNLDSSICSYLVLDEFENKFCRFTLKDSTLHSNLVFFKNSEIEFDISYSDGELTGLVKNYYSKERIRVMYTYRKGVPEGSFFYYKKSGKIWFKGEYINGILDENSLVKYTKKYKKMNLDVMTRITYKVLPSELDNVVK